MPHYVVLLGRKLALEGPLVPIESLLHQILHVFLRAVGGDAVTSLSWVWFLFHYGDHFQLLLRCCYSHASLAGSKSLCSFDKGYSSVGGFNLWMVLRVGVNAD